MFSILLQTFLFHLLRWIPFLYLGPRIALLILRTFFSSFSRISCWSLGIGFQLHKNYRPDMRFVMSILVFWERRFLLYIIRDIWQVILSFRFFSQMTSLSSSVSIMIFPRYLKLFTLLMSQQIWCGVWHNFCFTTEYPLAALFSDFPQQIDLDLSSFYVISQEKREFPLSLDFRSEERIHYNPLRFRYNFQGAVVYFC